MFVFCTVMVFGIILLSSHFTSLDHSEVQELGGCNAENSTTSCETSPTLRGCAYLLNKQVKTSHRLKFSTALCQGQTNQGGENQVNSNFYVQQFKEVKNLKVDCLTATTSYSGYDAALYSAATMYVAQQTQPNTAAAQSVGQQKTTTNTWNFKKPMGFGFKLNRAKGPAKPQQLHYCEVCKISCAGPQVITQCDLRVLRLQVTETTSNFI